MRARGVVGALDGTPRADREELRLASAVSEFGKCRLDRAGHCRSEIPRSPIRRAPVGDSARKKRTSGLVSLLRRHGSYASCGRHDLSGVIGSEPYNGDLCPLHLVPASASTK